jgi:hypothetical protein
MKIYTPDNRYFIGCDLATNTKSHSSLCVMKNKEIVHTLTTNKTWKIKLVLWYYKYFKVSTFIVENDR